MPTNQRKSHFHATSLSAEGSFATISTKSNNNNTGGWKIESTTAAFELCDARTSRVGEKGRTMMAETRGDENREDEKRDWVVCRGTNELKGVR